jgi:tungstate transport system substrate-binding protein
MPPAKLERFCIRDQYKRSFYVRTSRYILVGTATLLLLVCFNIGLTDDRVLHMATTTSTDNTGLLDYLAPLFEADTGIELRWIAVGTGKALALGRNCDVDVLMVHSPPAEREYIESGYGLERHQFMYNDFIIVGPPDDPAGIRGIGVREALTRLSRLRFLFVSRGDDSGTHKKEIFLWNDAGLTVLDRNRWYIQTGQGMLGTLIIADEKNGYTLTDRGTYIKYSAVWGSEPYLQILVEGDRALRNPYSVIAVNPERCPTVRQELAQRFIHWILSSRAQGLIEDFRLGGKQLFNPDQGISQ